jgi:hypothetical protein
MARRITRKELLKQDEVLDAAVDAGHWLEENWKALTIAAAALVVAIVGVVGWRSLAAERRARGEERLAAALAEYTRLEGAQFTDRAGLEGVLATFTELAEDAVGPARLTARFYQAAALVDLGRPDEAAPLLQQIAGDTDAPPTLRASAQGLLARTHAAAGRTDEAIGALRALLDDESGIVPAPQLLMQTAQLQSEAGREADARASWQRIVDEFPSSPLARTARERLGTAEPAD